MRTRRLFLAAGLLVVVTAAGAQPPPAGVPVVIPGNTIPPQVVPPLLPTAPAFVPAAAPFAPSTPPLVPTAPAESSVEQLLKELEAVQAQKADILKREADLKTAVQKKLEAIQKQADKLGAGKAQRPDVSAVPARVGRILIEGAADKKVHLAAREALQAVGLVPGADYRRAALDQAREVMAAGGLTRASLETVTSGQGADGGAILDIRVRFAPADNP